MAISEVEYFTLGAQFNHFQTYSTKIINNKNEIEILARFPPILDFELKILQLSSDSSLIYRVSQRLVLTFDFNS